MTKATLAFEIGTEEIPAFDLSSATRQLERLVPESLDSARIPHGDVTVLTTPRRLIVMVADVEDATEALVEEYKGPAARIAFDESGAPTKAAIGFARGKGLDVTDLERRDVDGTEYVFATRSIESLETMQLLPELLKGLITGINWPKSMRWASRNVTFSRPVRWLCALYGSAVVPVSYDDLNASNVTWGHRVLSPGEHTVADADSLLSVLAECRIVVGEDQRRSVILDGIAEIEKQTGLRCDTPENTLREVINLTEYPQPLACTFDEEFLDVPDEIIVDAMLVHQRYFPLYDGDELTNRFVIVSNGDPAYAATIIDGNERVVRARLDDAKFFYEEDLKRPLESYVEELDKVVFQENLGTVLDKTNRICKLASHFGSDAALSTQDRSDLERAARLCKADLVTNAVIEFTSVQGVMGSYYAQAAGESAQVVQAIADQYRPRFSGDDAPASTVGKLLATADKLDTICGLFSVGQAPTGSSDPFALRRCAIGIVNMLADGLPIALLDAIDVSLDTFSALDFDRAAVRAEVVEFFITRTKVMLKDAGFASDAIDAVLACGIAEPSEIIKRTKALVSARTEMPDVMDDLATAYARANNLREDALGTAVDESLLDEVSHALVCAINEADRNVSRALETDDYAQALKSLSSMRAPIDLFFDRVKVMNDDEAIKANNLRMLNAFVDVFSRVADFSVLAK